MKTFVSSVGWTPTAVRVRRGGWLFVLSFLGFVSFVMAIAVGQPGLNAAQDEAAERLGVGVNDLPVEVLAQIHREHNDVLILVVLLVLVGASFGLFVGGVRALVRGAGGPLAVGATVAAMLAPVCWAGVFALDVMISFGTPSRGVLDLYDAAFGPLIAASTVLASVALIGVVVVLRPAGVVGRTGFVVLALSVLAVLAAVSVGAPPIVPLLLGAVLGVALIRSARSSAVA